MRHIPALDGVRGSAVLLVMLFHLHVPGFSLGWTGVTLFFVLSGFLITGILVDAKERALADYLRTFFIRRSLRIFPLFYAYLVVNAALQLAMGRSLAGYGWYVSYLSNYQIGSALSMGRDLPGLVGHTWSLAVEEQFYLIWPFVVFFLTRRQLVWLCAGLIVIAPATRWAIAHDAGNVFMANVTLPSCLDAMAYGGLLALMREPPLSVWCETRSLA